MVFGAPQVYFSIKLILKVIKIFQRCTTINEREKFNKMKEKERKHVPHVLNVNFIFLWLA